MRAFTSFVLLIALVLSLFAPRTARAQTYQQIMSGGRYTLATGLTGINVDVLRGSNKAVANSNVLSATTSWVVMFGMKVQHAVLISKPMTYINLTNYSVTPAHVVVTLTQIGAYGQGGFQIVSNLSGAVLAQTTINGVYAELPFTSGYVSIGE